MFLLNLLLPRKDEGLSRLEMRTLSAMPSFTMEKLWSGQYFREFDNYFADHFIFRDALVQYGTELKALRGLKGEEEGSIIVQKGGNNMFQDRAKNGLVIPPDIVKEQNALRASAEASAEKPQAPAQSRPSEQEAAPASNPEADVSSTRDTESARYLVLKDRAMTLYSYYPSAAQSLTKGINDFQSKIDPSIKVYSMLAPSSVEFIKEAKYKELSASQRYAVNEVHGMYNKRLTPIDALKELSKHADEYIYFLTDHHWTGLGAYYAYKAFAEQIGEQPVPLSKYETEKLEDYLGSAYSATLEPNLKKNPDTITIYKPIVPYRYSLYWSNDTPLPRNVVDIQYGHTSAGGYAVFLGGDSPWGEITTENNNGKKLLVIKDSYGNPVIPFLLPHYEQITFIDLRYFDMPILDFVKEKGITEVLFINGISTTTYEGYDEMLAEKL